MFRGLCLASFFFLRGRVLWCQEELHAIGAVEEAWPLDALCAGHPQHIMPRAGWVLRLLLLVFSFLYSEGTVFIIVFLD